MTLENEGENGLGVGQDSSHASSEGKLLIESVF